MNNTYIALLRGINVSGQKKILMADLRGFLEEASFQNVQTYIQSGNIVFQSSEIDLNVLQKQISSIIEKEYGFEVPTLVKTIDQLLLTVKQNPFTSEQYKGVQQVYVTFLDTLPSLDNLQKLDGLSYLDEEYHLVGDIVYFYSVKGYGSAKMNNNFFEKKLKVSATTRNWKTIIKLIKLANEA